MPTKTVKKLDANVVRALTNACEIAKTKIQGFDWLTHSASYDNFPASLRVTCVFLTKDDYQKACSNDLDDWLIKLIHAQLLKVGVLLKKPNANVRFDTEQACHQEHGGNWQLRLEK